MTGKSLKTLLYVFTAAASLALFAAQVFAWQFHTGSQKGSEINTAEVEVSLTAEKWYEDQNSYYRLQSPGGVFNLEITDTMEILTRETREFYKFTVKNISKRALDVSLSYVRAEYSGPSGPSAPVYAENMLMYQLINDKADNFAPDTDYLLSRALTPFDYTKDNSNPHYTAGGAGVDFLLPLGARLPPGESHVFYMCLGYNMHVVFDMLRQYSDIPRLALVCAADLRAYARAVSEVAP